MKTSDLILPSNPDGIDDSVNPSSPGRELTKIDSVRAITRRWSTMELSQLFEPGEGCLVREYTEYLSERYQLNPDVALTITCLAISATAGPARVIGGPGMMENVPALHTIIVTDQPAAIQLALSDTFQIPLNQVVRIMFNTQLADRSKRGEQMRQIENMKREAVRLRQLCKEEKEVLIKSWGIDYERKLQVCFSKNPPEYWEREKEIARLDEQALKQYSDLIMADKPLFVTEGMMAGEYPGSEEHVFDGAMFNVDVYGASWTGLLAENPPRRSVIARRMLAGWRCVPFARNGKAVTAGMLSSIAVLSPETFSRVWNDRQITESGLRDVLTVVNGDSESGSTFHDAGKSCDVDSSVGGRFASHLTDLIQSRCITKRQRVEMSAEARDVFFEFFDEVRQVASTPHHVDSTLLRSAPQQALRFALMLHLGAGKTEDHYVDADTMTQAAKLVGWLASRSTPLLNRTSIRHEGTASDEILAMVVRVRRKGTVTKRQLFRSYNNQDYERLTPILEEAIDTGLLMETEDGRLTLPS